MLLSMGVTEKEKPNETGSVSESIHHSKGPNIRRKKKTSDPTKKKRNALFLLRRIAVEFPNPTTMISVLAQERLLGAALGSAFTGFLVFEQRKCIYKSIAQNQAQFSNQPQMKEPLFENKTRLDVAHVWNKAVDQTLGPVISSLSSRGW